MEFATIVVLFVVFAILIGVGLPISYAIGLSSFAALLVAFPPDVAATVIAQKTIVALDSFGLLAIPFFILAGNLMNTGGMARRLVDFALAIAGPLPGALAQCNIIANMLFGAISGSAVAAAAAVGSVMTPIQREKKYDPNFSAAINIASCPTGLLIPPSGSLILYSLVSGGTSVAALFIAGYIPGILMGVSLMIWAFFVARKKDYPRSPFLGSREVVRRLVDALPSLALIVIVIGGIIKGVFTATEASAVAVVYCIVLSFIYGEIRLKSFYQLFVQSAATTAVVLFLVGTSVAMSWVMASANVPAYVSNGLMTLSSDPIVILLIMNLILLIVGTFMDLTPALLIFTPIFLPVAMKVGVDPVHFGIILVFNLCIGICTPPVGSALFVGCGVARVPIVAVLRHLLPMYVVLIATLLLVTYVPSLSLWLPRWMGLM